MKKLLSKWWNKIWPDKYKLVRLSRFVETMIRFNRVYSRFSNAWKWEVKIDGKEVPWFNYPAIEYLERMPLRNKRIFEWGSGASTIFFAERGAKVTSIETDGKWAHKVLEQIWKVEPTNESHSWVFERVGDNYVECINNFLGDGEKYDLIVIDGPINDPLHGEMRYRCAQEAINNLDDDGIIILDNADWCPRTYEYLATRLYPVPFIGFAPLVPYATTTVFFFKNPKFSLQEIGIAFRYNRHGRGAIKQELETYNYEM